MQLYEIKPSTAYIKVFRAFEGEAFIVHCPPFVRPSKVPRGDKNQCDLTQNSPVHNWPFVDLWRWNADTVLFSQPLNELSICPECCEREVNSLVGHESFLPVINIPALYARTVSLALENKLDLSCMVSPGKFNELLGRYVASYINITHIFSLLLFYFSIFYSLFIYLFFIYLFILEFSNILTVFLFFFSILLVCLAAKFLT